MPLNVKINQTNPSPKVVNVRKLKKEQIKFALDIKKTLNGDLMIFDHRDIDIVMLLEKKKIVTFAKDIMSETVYGAQSRFFDYLKKRGIIAFDSIQAGNVYGSLEGQINESKELNEFKLALKNISEWLQEEVPEVEYDDMVDDYYTNPDDYHSTELGEVPHDEEKGSILQHNLFAPYLYGRYTY